MQPGALVALIRESGAEVSLRDGQVVIHPVTPTVTAYRGSLLRMKERLVTILTLEPRLCQGAEMLFAREQEGGMGTPEYQAWLIHFEKLLHIYEAAYEAVS